MVQDDPCESDVWFPNGIKAHWLRTIALAGVGDHS